MPDISPLKYKGETTNLSLSKIQLPEVRIVNDEEFPIALGLDNAYDASMEEKKELLTEMAKNGVVDELLARHGALVLRGFNETDPKNLDELLIAIEKTRNHVPFQQCGAFTERTQFSENIFSASEAPPSRRLHQHVEFCRFKNFPKTLIFLGYKINDIEGGETPLMHTAELYNVMVEQHPEFIDKLTKKGLYMSQTWQNENPKTGFTWEHKSAFGWDIEPEDTLGEKRQKVQKLLKGVSDDYEWMENGDLKIEQHTRPIRLHPKTRKPELLSSLPIFYSNIKIGRDMYYKPDSSPISYDDEAKEPIREEHLDAVLEISKQIEYNHKWEQGDIVLIDNYQTSHGRLPWKGHGNRVVLVSMWDDKEENRMGPEVVI